MKSLNFEHQVGVSRLLEHRLRSFETDLESFLDLLKAWLPAVQVQDRDIVPSLFYEIPYTFLSILTKFEN